MRIAFALSLLMLVSSLAVSASRAEEKKRKKESLESYGGDVTAVDRANSTFEVARRNAAPRTFHYTDETAFDARVIRSLDDIPTDRFVHFFGKLSDDKKTLEAREIISPPSNARLRGRLEPNVATGAVSREGGGLFVEAKGRKVEIRTTPKTRVLVSERTDASILAVGRSLGLSYTEEDGRDKASRVFVTVTPSDLGEAPGKSGRSRSEPPAAGGFRLK